LPLTKKKGYRDARILSDTITYLKDENALSIKINVEEGNKYYFGDIKFFGNTVYSNQLLSRIIGVKKTYNGVLFRKESLTSLNQTEKTLLIFIKITDIYFQI
jgi:outer membrane protein insertion porin family